MKWMEQGKWNSWQREQKVKETVKLTTCVLSSLVWLKDKI